MANTLYYSARSGFAQGQYNWVTDNIAVVLIDTTQYTFSASHSTYSQIPVAARIASASLSGKAMTATGGCDASDVSMANVTGNYVGAMILYKVAGTEATSPLLAYFDTISGLPFTPSGGAVLIPFDPTNGVFVL